MTKSTHLIDYRRHSSAKNAFSEWLYWIEAMAFIDVGIYD